MSKRVRMAFIAILLSSFSQAHTKQIHKCIDEGGVISYQEKACVEPCYLR